MAEVLLEAVEGVLEAQTLAASDEMNDFVAVAGSDTCFLPAIFGKNTQVALYGDAVSVNAEVGK